jgi:hypothetical protein
MIPLRSPNSDVDNARMSRAGAGNTVSQDQTATVPDHSLQEIWNTTAHLEMSIFAATEIEADWLYY